MAENTNMRTYNGKHYPLIGGYSQMFKRDSKDLNDVSGDLDATL